MTDAQRAELERARDRDPRPYLRECAGALLMIADRRAPHWVARHGLLKPRDPDTVYGWLRRYRERGLPGLAHRPRGHRGLPPLQAAAVVEHVRQAPALHGLARARWRLADLRATLPCLGRYTLSGVSQVLRRLNVRRQRGRLALHSPDLAYHRKLALVARACALARRQPEAAVVCYGDEFSLHRQPTLAPAYAPAGEAPRAPLSHRANTRHRFSGALDLVTGRVTWSGASVMGVASLGAFLRRLRRSYPRRRLILIWDNWPVHLHPEVLALAAELGIELLWLPTYAPWTNPIEKLWRWLKQTLLHHHRLADQWPELKAQVVAFLDQFAHGSPALLRYVGLLPD